MGPFGPMDCVICECKSGRIECHRLECPSRQALNCDRPVKVAGRCCPVCPLEADTSGPISPSATVTRDASRTSTHVTRPRTNATHSRSSATSSSSGKSSSSRHSGALSLCLPSDHDVMVYRAQGGGNASEYIQVIRLSLKFTVNKSHVRHSYGFPPNSWIPTVFLLDSSRIPMDIIIMIFLWGY